MSNDNFKIAISCDVINNLSKIILFDISNLTVNDDHYILSNDEIKLIKSKISREIDRKLNTLKNNGINLNSNIKKMHEKYSNMNYESIRDSFHALNTNKYNQEDILKLGYKLINEIEDAINIPGYKKKIEFKLDEVSKYKLSYALNSLTSRFKRNCELNSSINEFKDLNKELDRLIKSSYTSNVLSDNNILNKEISFIVGKDSSNASLLTKENLTKYDYGYIYNPSDIILACNINNNNYLSYNHLDKLNNKVVLKEDAKPIGVFSITLGEKSLNKNYNEAKKLIQYKDDLFFCEIDLFRYLSKNEIQIYKNDMIDSLVQDKGIDYINKNKVFYQGFEYFFNKYNELKLKDYNESNILNLFDCCYNYRYSQKFNNLDELFSGRYSTDEVNEVLHNSIYHEYLIFRYSYINTGMTKKFIDKYYNYKDSASFNIAFPGVSFILEKLHDLSLSEIKSFCDEINNIYSNSHQPIDSWYVYQKFNPSHSKENINKKTDSVVLWYKDVKNMYSFLDYLKSNDEDKQPIYKGR